MSLTAAKLKATVTAETEDANRKLKEFGQNVTGTARNSSSSLAGLGQAFDGLGLGIGRFAGPAGVGLAIAGAAKLAISADSLRQQSQNTERQLIAFAGSATNAAGATDALLRATDNGVSKMQAMGMASQLLGMGLATTSDQVYDLSRMAVMLGDKTLSVQDRMSSWNAMMANQSIERLDTFGISSGRVRAEIERLQAAMPGLSREQAFVNAVLEIGGQKLRAVEREGVTAAGSIDKLNAQLANLKNNAAEKIEIEVAINVVTQAVGNLAHAISDEGEIERRYGQAFENYRRAVEGVNRAQEELGRWYANITPMARANYEAKLADAQAAEQEALAAYEAAQAAMDLALSGDKAAAASAALGSVASGVSSELDGMTTSLISNTTWLREFKAAADAVARERDYLYGKRAPNTTGSAYEDGYSDMLRDPVALRAAATQDSQRYLAEQERLRIEEATRRQQAAARSVASEWENAMRAATDRWSTAFQQGMQNSINLLDLRPGGQQGPNAPGQNGAFEEIYRLQAFINDGTWAETAQKHGLDKAGATDVVRKFQMGQWDESVMKLIDTPKLTEQIQQAQLGQAMMDAVAADLAKASGADPKLIKTMLGIGGGTDGGPLKLDLGGQFVPSLTTAIDAELTAKGEDLKTRGGAAWSLMETGMLDRAQRSTKFVQMIEAMVDNALENYVPAE